jgi:hypothetical protein
MVGYSDGGIRVLGGYSMTGYENEPEYGGPDPSWKEALVLAAIMGGATAVLLLLTL